jgi:hypothetical protein
MEHERNRHGAERQRMVLPRFDGARPPCRDPEQPVATTGVHAASRTALRMI